MKRKRGNRKGRPRGRPPAAATRPPQPPSSALAADDVTDEEAENFVSIDSKDNSDVGDEAENNDNNNSSSSQDDDDANQNHNAPPPVSPMEVDAPPPPLTGTGREKPPVIVFNRVKVKLKTSKPPPPPAAVVESPGNNNMNSKNNIENVEEMKEDKGREKGQGSVEVIKASTSSPAKKNDDSSAGGKDEPKTPWKPQYDKQELDSALMIIKKVMKMDAAEPFNVPVNPEALGIPDYFEIIDTPMDFGTICSNLEKGNKYMNSEDVYKDVQFIWDNCYKYNSKGDYILDLMRRVKKNFMKYWTAARLYTEQTRGSSGTEGVPGEDVAASSQANAKTKKTKKRHGRRHKNDCLCAICVLKRRRREREENERLAKGQIGVNDDKFTQEESSLMESPDGEDSSSNIGESQDPDAEVEVQGQELEVKVEAEKQSDTLEDKHEEEVAGENEDDEEEEENKTDIKRVKADVSEQSQFTKKQGEEPSQQLQLGIAGNESAANHAHTEKSHGLMQEEEELLAARSTRHKESLERAQKAKLYEHLYEENPLLLDLCANLFPRNHTSVWSGPHSLVPHQVSTRRSSIHETLQTLMK